MDKRQVYSVSLKLLTLLGVTIVMAVMINSLFPVEGDKKKAHETPTVEKPQTVSVVLTGLQPGKVKFVQWAGKPVSILRRNDAPQDFAKGEPLNEKWRSVRADYFIFYNSSGAAQCPLYLMPGGDQLKDTCSGALYDSSGRRIKGQGSALSIPPYYFADDVTLVIGKWHR